MNAFAWSSALAAAAFDTTAAAAFDTAAAFAAETSRFLTVVLCACVLPVGRRLSVSSSAGYVEPLAADNAAAAAAVSSPYYRR